MLRSFRISALAEAHIDKLKACATNSDLENEAAPGVAALIAEQNATRIGKTGDGLTLGIAEPVADGVLVLHFDRSLPRIALLIAEPDVFAVAEAEHSLRTR